MGRSLPISDDDLRADVALWRLHGCNATQTADANGIPRSTLKDRLAQARARGLILSEGAKAIVDKAKLGYGEAKGGWIHDYDADGKKVGTTRWAAEEVSPEGIAERVAAVLNGITRADVIPSPRHSDDSLLTVYPLADVHIGLMAWGKETGEDYDTNVATERLRTWIARAVDAAPSSAHAVILGVGDLTHADDQSNMTPTSKHILDVDTRHFKTLDATISSLAYCIEYAAQKHDRVTVRILPGNHDLTSYMSVMFALAERYRDNPRIEVQKVPGEFWVFRHGKCMLAAHHGHGGKPERMVFFLADEYAADWGQTRHRTLFTGHHHHAKMADIGGVQWEQLRAITARDAYATSNAYVARAQLQAITYDAERGEVMRIKVNG